MKVTLLLYDAEIEKLKITGFKFRIKHRCENICIVNVELPEEMCEKLKINGCVN
jgi:hypothetical protein